MTRVTKVVPNKVTRKLVPALVSSSANSSSTLVSNKIFCWWLCANSENWLDFQKRLQANFTDEVFDIIAIPTQPPILSLIDAEKKEINGKFWEKKVWLGTKLIMTKMGNDEFTLHLISTASKDYFPNNILASFRKFCKKENASNGDWRVALSEKIFRKKLINVTDE